MKSKRTRKGREWQSPGLIMTAKRGLPLYMPPPMMTDLEGLVGVAIPVGDLLGLAGHLGAMMSSPTCPRKMLPWLPAGADVVMTLSDLVERKQSNISGPIASLKLDSEKGRQHLSAESLLEILNSGIWDWGVMPAEQAPWMDATCGTKKSRRSVQESQYFVPSLNLQHSVPLFANLQGGACSISRQHAAEDLDHSRYAGYFLGGFETHTVAESANDDDIHNKRLEALTTSLISLGDLAQAKCTMVAFDGTCAEIITAVLAGVDLIQIGFPSFLAKKGLQIFFMIDLDLENTPPTGMADIRELLKKVERSEMPVRAFGDKKYRQCFEPFTNMSRSQGDWAGFGRGYTCAYVHHLLNSREALAHQLLEWHNWRLLISWFEKLQSFRHDEAGLCQYLRCFIHANLLPEVPAYDLIDRREIENYELPPVYTAY